MTIVGYQFDRAKVSASNDAALYNSLANGKSYILDGQGSGLQVTVSGLTATVGTGMALICGRLVEVTEAETVTLPASSKGYLVIAINLSKSNTSVGTLGMEDYSVVNNQLSVKFVTNLTQQSLTNGGLAHTFNLGAVTTTTSSATFTKAAGTQSVLAMVKEFVTESQTVAKKQASIGYGTTGTLYRTGTRVRFELNSNQTLKRTNGSITLAEKIPAGYRPRIATQAHAIMMIGASFQGAKKLLLNFVPNGTIHTYAEGMDVSPINLVMSVEWETTDDFPIGDISK
ncbi:TPA: hypothetical protein TXL57_001747 [Streptococcus suis]|nr:hypothetical protein [Streptococcus suis]